VQPIEAGIYKGLEVRFDVINLLDQVYQIRSGTGLGVFAPQFGPRRTFLAELHSPRSDVVILLSTFVLTVLVDLTVAIEVGMVLAPFLFMRRMASVASVDRVTHDLDVGDEESAAGAGANRRWWQHVARESSLEGRRGGRRDRG